MQIFGTKAPPEAPAAVPCEALRRFSPSRADTRSSIEQAIAHNRIFDRFCSSPAAAPTSPPGAE